MRFTYGFKEGLKIKEKQQSREERVKNMEQ